MAARMKSGRDIFPKSLPEMGAFAFVVFIIPSIYWFELYVVLPSFYPVWSFWYNVHFLCGTFIMCNITSNFVAVICTDTSIRGLMLPTTLQPNWRFCPTCFCISPPRSWHCDVCNTCIMRRDHHCMFTGCCIGHHNYRFFIIFTAYALIATVYATYYNSFFMWDRVDFRTPMILLKLVFPLAMLMFGIDMSATQCYIMFYVIIFVTLLFMLTLLIIHIRLVLNGTTYHEGKNNLNQYDLGWQQNVKEFLGENWLVACFFPFAPLRLPSNGIDWNTKDTWKMEGSKSRSAEMMMKMVDERQTSMQVGFAHRLSDQVDTVHAPIT